jgi:hypothetical protein
MCATSNVSDQKSPRASARPKLAQHAGWSFAETPGSGRILGAIDGIKTQGIQPHASLKRRKEFWRNVGYKP